MADYIYLLENRLSPAQKEALSVLRGVTRSKGLTLFLVGGAVRDLTSGSPVRDLDVAVQGNALKLRKELELAGGLIAGVHETGQALYLKLASVRVEVCSTMTATYPKPAKVVLKPGTILEDLRRRDFTANAMALSLNEGSYGLLMDPLNGVADIENRELRLVSNYGFIEEPVRLIRAARFAARLGWTLEEKTQARYETAKQEGYVSGLSEFHRGYELEEIVHEEDPLRVMRRLESEGWMQILSPVWSAAKANAGELEKVREAQTQLQMQGIHPDAATVNFPVLTAKLPAKDIEALKKHFPRQGFVAEIDHLEAEAKVFATQLGGKGTAAPSASFRLIREAKPDIVLFVAYTTKSGALQAKFKSFFTDWPQARQKLPFALMLEMRITPELAGYDELVERLFFELMDGRLSTVEEMRAFLEPFSPPAPPPPVHLRRPRAARKDGKKARSKKDAALAQEDSEDAAEDDMDDVDVASDDEPEEVEDLGGTLDPGVEAELMRVAASEEEDDPDEDEDEGGSPEAVEEAAPEPVKVVAPRGKGKTAATLRSEEPAERKKGGSSARSKPVVQAAPPIAARKASRVAVEALPKTGKVVAVPPEASKRAMAKPAKGAGGKPGVAGKAGSEAGGKGSSSGKKNSR